MSKFIKNTIFLTPLLLFLAFLVYEQHISALDAIFIVVGAAFAIYMNFRNQGPSFNMAALNQNEQSLLFLNIMENLTDPLVFLNDNATIFMANKSATEMFGSDLINHRIADFLMDTDALAAINKAIKTGKSDTVEYSTSNPRIRNYLLRIHVHDKSNQGFPEDRTILLTIYDITSIREAERMRVDFVANVSHELRTPLASILGFVETLQGPAKDDQKAMMRFLKIMQDEANRMTRLIEDLLSLSHIERDAHIPPSENVALKKIIESVIETLKFRLEKRDMTTRFITKDLEGKIIGDRDQLTQVFQNLIDNAIKYGAEHSEISVNMEKYEDSKTTKKYVKTTVMNLGAGIAPEHIERLTERFYRVDTARSRSLGGTGLGLAIVKHIIQRHEGKLSIESEVGHYTKVTVLLPEKL